jgi:hypothetical protein
MREFKDSVSGDSDKPAELPTSVEAGVTVPDEHESTV